jgi:sortase A
MAKQKTPDQLTPEELRRMLVEKSRASHRTRLEHFRRTGRVLNVQPVEGNPPEDLSSEHGEDPAGDAPRTGRKPSKRRKVMDRVLFFVEIMAVIGLLLVLLNGANLLRALNTEVVSAVNQPKTTPTALITAVVLPGGHTPPVGGREPQFNEAEIPAHLRPVVQSLASLPMPTAGPETARNIRIPSIGVDQVIVQGDGWDQLKKGVGQGLGSPNPGQKGNIVLSAHNDIYGETFRDLDKMKVGDEIILSSQKQDYVYIVVDTAIVDPNRVDLLNQSPEAVVTLVSCYPYMVDTQRVVVLAQLKSP